MNETFANRYTSFIPRRPGGLGGTCGVGAEGSAGYLLLSVISPGSEVSM